MARIKLKMSRFRSVSDLLIQMIDASIARHLRRLHPAAAEQKQTKVTPQFPVHPVPGCHNGSAESGRDGLSSTATIAAQLLLPASPAKDRDKIQAGHPPALSNR
jgi:hypothetical protein